MNNHKIMYQGHAIAEAPSLSDAYSIIRRLRDEVPEKYSDSCIGTTKLTIKIVPEDEAQALWRRARALEDVGKLDMKMFLSEVYGVLKDDINKSVTNQDLIQAIIERNYG